MLNGRSSRNAKVSPELYAALENVCQMLDLTKREFIESAVADAVQLADEHIERMANEMQPPLGRKS